MDDEAIATVEKINVTLRHINEDHHFVFGNGNFTLYDIETKHAELHGEEDTPLHVVSE